MREVNFLKPISIKRKIRLGPNSDGGYVVYERILKDTDVLVTYGIGYDITFEEHFNTLTGKEVRMFDPTIFGKYLFNYKYFGKQVFSLRFKPAFMYILWIRAVWKKMNELKKKGVYFINEGIGCRTTKKYDTFENHVHRFGLQNKRILLKIDIEGSEFDIFKDKSFYSSLKNVNQILIEFHDLKYRLREFQNILEKLQKDFDLIHIHGNNYGCTFIVYDLFNEDKQDVVMPDVVEITFVRKSEINTEDILDQQQSYPVKELDFPNNPNKHDYAIPFM